MTKSFEVSIAIMILLSFVFFVFEIYTLDYSPMELPEGTRNLLLNKAKDSEFRTLVDNKDVDNIYELLHSDIDQKYSIKICDSQENDCVLKDIGISKNKKIVGYYFANIDKTIYILFY